MDLCQLDNTYEIPEAMRHCTMEQLTGQNFSIFSIVSLQIFTIYRLFLFLEIIAVLL